MSMSANDYLTVAEAAKLLRVSVSTIRRWIREGTMSAHRIGSRRLLLKRDELMASVRAVDPASLSTDTMSPAPRTPQRAKPGATVSASTVTDQAKNRPANRAMKEATETRPPETGRNVDEMGEERTRRLRARLGLPPEGEELDLGPAADLIIHSSDRIVDRRLTPQEQARALEAMDRAAETSARIHARLNGISFPPSWKLINDARDELSRRLDHEEPYPDPSDS